MCPSLSWQSIIHKSIISYLTFWRQNSSSAMYYFFRHCPSLIICLLFQDAGFFKDSWHLTLDAKHWKTCNSFFWSYLFIYLFVCIESWANFFKLEFIRKMTFFDWQIYDTCYTWKVYFKNTDGCITIGTSLKLSRIIMFFLIWSFVMNLYCEVFVDVTWLFVVIKSYSKIKLKKTYINNLEENFLWVINARLMLFTLAYCRKIWPLVRFTFMWHVTILMYGRILQEVTACCNMWQHVIMYDPLLHLYMDV